MEYNFSHFPTGIVFADDLTCGTSMHNDAEMVAAFATCHEYGKYSKGDAYTIERKLCATDFSVYYIITVHA